MMMRIACFVIGAAAGSVGTLAQVSSTPDALTKSPHLYSVKLENDRVRVMEYALKPGQVEPMHSHGSFVVRFLSDAKIRATTPDGQSAESDVRRGDVGWRDPMAHAIQNVGTTDVQAFIVDVKPCRATP
jgi:beta-alanine degradation protein BauB